MFLQKKGTSWSATLLRDELFHAGIRHSRTRLPEWSWPVPDSGDGRPMADAASALAVFQHLAEGNHAGH